MEKDKDVVLTHTRYLVFVRKKKTLRLNFMGKIMETLA